MSSLTAEWSQSVTLLSKVEGSLLDTSIHQLVCISMWTRSDACAPRRTMTGVSIEGKHNIV